ncbi:hypothetical protein TRIUR3_19064 [Triticum urartu]|uniref:Uncharacterized protein n=1 Tax=Triticum urartu TaxID=4572 RepID=M8A6I4_TRIUA|nr:hypothetical protein TRIUR3_19064 [Triticum urartu]
MANCFVLIASETCCRWLAEQKKMANVTPDSPVYLSLRMDGRVRGSGVGYPPWQAFVAQLPQGKGQGRPRRGRGRGLPAMAGVRGAAAAGQRDVVGTF